MHADHVQLGRTYFPGLDMDNFTQESKARIEEDIDKDFQDGLDGIRRLPKGARYGVYSAYVYYYNLFKKIKKLNTQRLLQNKRIRVPNSAKYGLLITSYLRYRFNML
jgi:phytoene/squalene synthetase